jgi:DNA repair exonuclease SbcCD ATPase subunit
MKEENRSSPSPEQKSPKKRIDHKNVHHSSKSSQESQEKKNTAHSSRSKIPNSVKLFASWPNEGSSDEGTCHQNSPLCRSDIQDKLGSPSRERNPRESIRKLEERQAKAQETRERLLVEKVQRSKDKSKKVEEIKAWQEEQSQQKLVSLSTKLQKAEELREQHITKIKMIAHDEDLKVDEILFINKIEAANKRLDVMSKEKDVEARLLDLQEERKNRKKEENAAKEAAAEERKRQLEVERHARVQQIMEKIREKEEKIGHQMIEKEKERAEQANLKQLQREKKISAVNAAHQQIVEQLQLKIQQKQEASEKRKQENMHLIRQKAFELSVRKCTESDDHTTPKNVPYETIKMCSVCKVLIGSEIYLFSHLRGKTHQNAIRKQYEGREDSMTKEDIEVYNMQHIIDAPISCLENFDSEFLEMEKSRLKSIKKRIARLRNRMTAKGDATEFKKPNDLFGIVDSKSSSKTKLIKLMKDLSIGLDPSCKVPISLSAGKLQTFDRAIVSLETIFRSCSGDKLLFASLGGIHVASQVILQIVTSESIGRHSSQLNQQFNQPFVPNKTLVRFLHAIGLVSFSDDAVSTFVFNSNIITCCLDLLEQRLTVSLTKSCLMFL